MNDTQALTVGSRVIWTPGSSTRKFYGYASFETASFNGYVGKTGNIAQILVSAYGVDTTHNVPVSSLRVAEEQAS